MNRPNKRKPILILLILCCMILLLPELVPQDPTALQLKKRNNTPTWSHLFGTDLKGRDLFARVLYGTRLSLMIGLCATMVSLFIGVTWGSIAGYTGGKLDSFMMRIVDILYGLPFMFIVIILMVIMGKSVLILFMALGLIQWLTMARVIRAEVLSVKERDFITAAKAIGVPKHTIIIRHILPNITGTIMVYATFTIPAIILEEAFLSFLGLGVPAPMSSLGTLIRSGVTTISIYPWQIIFPALALLILVYTINYCGWLIKKKDA